MASSGWPPLPGGVPPPTSLRTPKPSYINYMINETSKPLNPIKIKDLMYIHGEPTVLWEEEE
ncbi:hypothetical protein HAX54_027830, partial [Datura stramonium]|nr:hypothetical protein [Datura stramonium]